MISILVVGDLHLTEGKYFNGMKSAMDEIYDIVECDKSIHGVIQLGDLCGRKYGHRPTPLEFDTIMEWVTRLNTEIKYRNIAMDKYWDDSWGNVNILIIGGNHDHHVHPCYWRHMNSIRGIVYATKPRVEKTMIGHIACIPYPNQYWMLNKDETYIDSVDKFIESLHGCFKMIAYHGVFRGAKFDNDYPASDKVLVIHPEQVKDRLVICGHLHTAQKVGKNIYYPGTPYQLTKTDKIDKSIIKVSSYDTGECYVSDYIALKSRHIIATVRCHWSGSRWEQHRNDGNIPECAGDVFVNVEHDGGDKDSLNYLKEIMRKIPAKEFNYIDITERKVEKREGSREVTEATTLEEQIRRAAEVDGVKQPEGWEKDLNRIQVMIRGGELCE